MSRLEFGRRWKQELFAEASALLLKRESAPGQSPHGRQTLMQYSRESVPATAAAQPLWTAPRRVSAELSLFSRR